MSRDEGSGSLKIDVRRLARAARRERKTLVRFLLAVTVVAVAVAFLLPRWFTSSVTLVPAPKDGLSLDLTGIGEGLGGTSLNLGSGPTPQDQLKMVISSRAVADSLITRFDLVRRWNVDRRDQARDQLADHTTITTPKEGQLVVEVEDHSPALARDMAAAFAIYGASESARLKTSLAAQRRLYLEARLRELEREITLAGQQVREFEEKNGAIALPEQTKEVMDAAGTLQAQAALLETELAAARRYFTEQAPQVAGLRDQIGELNRQIAKLARQGGTLLLKGDQLPAMKQEYLGLAREQKSLIEVSEMLRRVYEQARVEEANPVASFSVLDAAEMPERHSRPKRGLLIAISVGLAMAAAVVWLQWLEMRADARRDSARPDVEHEADAGALAERRAA
jgi:uncharacterized protein involved in exopolysaccharide biosynthesis